MDSSKGKEEVNLVSQSTQTSTVIQIGEELDEIVDHPIDIEFKVPETPLFLAQTQSSEPQIDLNQLFQHPNFQNEDAKAGSDALTPEMLSSIRKTGRFVVPSFEFEGQENEWELSNLVQRGSEKTCEDFRNGVVFATKQYVVHVPNRLWKGHVFSFWNGFKSFFLSLFSIPKLLFGFPQSNYLPPKISKEKLRLSKLLDALTDKSYQNADVVNTFFELKEFSSNDNMRIIVHNFKFIKDSLSVPYDNLKKIWNLNVAERRKELVEKLSNQYKDPKELAQEVKDEEERLFQEEIFRLIHSTLPTDDAKNVVSLLNSIATIREAIYHHRKCKNNAMSIYRNELIAKHTILGRINEWVLDRMNVFEQKYDKTHPFDLNALSKKLEGAEAYLFRKNVELKDEIETDYKQLQTKEPKRKWDWSFRIWRPSKWIITNQNEMKEGMSPYYSVEKYKHFSTSTRLFGWRLGHIFVRFARNINNGLFGLISNMIYGPFGLRSLIGLDEFQPDRTVDSKTGELKPTGSKYTTWLGRINVLWKHISKSRRDFESAPNEGFFGKGFVRPFNVVWNYVCKGAIGTFFAFFGHPFITIVQTLFSILLIVTSPVWSLLHGVATYLWSVFIYDVDAPGTTVGLPFFQILVWRCIVKGLGQMVLAPLAALGNSLLGLLAIMGSSLRWTGRTLWDVFIFNTFIRFQGRIPRRNGFLARKIRGPGLGMQYYQQITSDFALLKLQHQFEQELVKNYEKEQEKFIDLPLIELEKYYAQFKEIGLVTDYEGIRIKKFKKTKETLQQKLRNAIRNHNDHLIVRGSPNFGYVRLSRDDLAFVLTEGEELCTKFFKTHLQNLIEDKAFWASKNLIQYDFSGLTRYYLEGAFSTNAIFQPLEELDSSGFRIKIDHVGFREFGRMIWKANPRDDLDKDVVIHGSVKYSQKGNNNLLFPSTSDVIVVTPDNFDSHAEYEAFVYLEQNQIKTQ